MKLLLGQGLLILLSVIILYYLLNAPTFLPYLEDGSINWQNLIVLIFFSSVILINLVSIIFVLIHKVFLKKELDKELFYRSIKFGLLFTFGIVGVFVLNYLHILNIYYGLGIFGIVLIMFFVI
jgi:cation transport ATPase